MANHILVFISTHSHKGTAVTSMSIIIGRGSPTICLEDGQTQFNVLFLNLDTWGWSVKNNS